MNSFLDTFKNVNFLGMNSEYFSALAWEEILPKKIKDVIKNKFFNY